jgi:hypothetical protein
MPKKLKQQKELKQSVINQIYSNLLTGKTVSFIKSTLLQKNIIQLHEWLAYRNAVYELLHDNSEFYSEIGKELQINRLETLYSEALDNGDGTLALNVLKEINKTLQLYENKVKVEVINYELEI